MLAWVKHANRGFSKILFSRIISFLIAISLTSVQAASGKNLEMMVHIMDHHLSANSHAHSHHSDNLLEHDHPAEKNEIDTPEEKKSSSHPSPNHTHNMRAGVEILIPTKLAHREIDRGKQIELSSHYEDNLCARDHISDLLRPPIRPS